MMSRVPMFFSLLILALTSYFVLSWLKEDIESAIVSISAPDEVEFALPVYAQFNVTQSLLLADIFSMTRLVVPVYVADPTMNMVIGVRWNDKIVQEWQLVDLITNSGGPGLKQVNMEFEKPVLLDGEVEVYFDGAEITHEFKESAPRLFTESDGVLYGAGNYRIAQNEKSGDVGMDFFGRQKRWQKFANYWYKNPMDGIFWLFRGALIALLLGAAPYSLWWLVRRR